MDALLRRRELLAGNEPVLSRVDYIETDGVAYIDTGIKGNAPMSVKLFNVVPVIKSSGNSYICGSRKDSGNTRFVFCVITDTKMAGYGYDSGIYGSQISVADSVDNHTPMQVQTSLKATEQRIYVKQAGESSYTNYSSTVSSDINTDRNLHVFGLNNQGTPSPAAAGTRIGYIKIYSDSTFSNIIFDAFACVYNGEYGMWDNVSNTFFGNAAGSGAFTGPQI